MNIRMVEVELVSDEKRFWDLKETWTEFQSGGVVKDITMTWEWMSTWWEVFKENRSLAVLIVRDGREVIGIAPFIRRRTRYFRLIPYIKLEFMGSGEDEEDEICSDYLNFIIRNGREQAVLDAIFKHLFYSGDIVCDELLLPRMYIESLFIPLMFDLVKELKLNIEELSRIPCLYANLPASFDEYLGQLGKKTRYKIRRGMRKLNEEGDVVFKVAETEEEVGATKKILIRLHQSRWTQKGKPGVFSSDKFRLFHDKIISISHKENWLRLGTLFLNQRPLACIYNLRFNNKIYSYQAGTEVSDNWDISYGILAHAYAIIHGISEASKEYDFLAGSSDYKNRLAKGQREMVTLRISKPSAKEFLYKTICRLKEMVKVVKDLILRKGENDK